MADQSRIPRTIEAFHKYLMKISTYLGDGKTGSNAARLGILEEEVTQINGLVTEMSPLYALYADKKMGRTTAVIDQLYNIMDRMISFDQDNHLLDRVASSLNVTVLDLETFNIHKGALQKAGRSVPQKPISDAVTSMLQPVGGGTVAVKCYGSTGARPSVPDDADCVQFAYQVGDTAPASAIANGLTKDISSRGSFNLPLGADTCGKTLYIYFRWYNTRHTELAGTWSSLQTTLIL